MTTASTQSNLSKTALLERRVLDLWKEYGGDYRTFTEFADALGPANGFDRHWLQRRRERKPEFREQMDLLEKNRMSGASEGSRAPFLAQERWPNLERWKGIYVERLRETNHRRTAYEMVGRTLKEIRQAAEEDPAFAEAIVEVEEELVADIEDAQMIQAKKGKGGAGVTSVLETQSSRLSKLRLRATIGGESSGGSFNQYDPYDARKRAIELHRRTSGYMPPSAESDDGDVSAVPARPKLAASEPS